jgi:phage replication-related protein YjqB (UPF0714/DUF867 family)
MTKTVFEATDTGHLTEFLLDDGENDDLVVCAAHGGQVEPGTADQAVELADRLPGATCWGCFGHDESDAFERWHRSSTAIRPVDFPLLDRIADRGFEAVVSLHGLATNRLLVGGGIEMEVKQRVRRRLDEATTADVETVTEGPYAGVSPRNFVNWLADDETGGLQLEQGPSVRDDESDAVVAALEALVTEDHL